MFIRVRLLIFPVIASPFGEQQSLGKHELVPKIPVLLLFESIFVNKSEHHIVWLSVSAFIIREILVNFVECSNHQLQVA